jgi:hypothetical protein
MKLYPQAILTGAAIGAVAGLLLAPAVYGWMHDHFEFMRYHPVIVDDQAPIIQITPPVASATQAN